ARFACEFFLNGPVRRFGNNLRIGLFLFAASLVSNATECSSRSIKHLNSPTMKPLRLWIAGFFLGVLLHACPRTSAQTIPLEQGPPIRVTVDRVNVGVIVKIGRASCR